MVHTLGLSRRWLASSRQTVHPSSGYSLFLGAGGTETSFGRCQGANYCHPWWVVAVMLREGTFSGAALASKLLTR